MPVLELSHNACKRFTCAIQACLKKNDFQEDQCASEIEALRRCCETFKDSPMASYTTCTVL